MNNVVNTDVIIMGDTNFDVITGHVGFDIFNSLLSSLHMVPCDDLILGPDNHTYKNDALQASSRIDHFFYLQPFKILHNAIVHN